MQPARKTGKVGEAGDTAAVTTAARRAPGPPAWTTLLALRRIAADQLGTLMRLHAEYGDLVRLNLVAQDIYMLRHPDQVQHVLHDRHTNYNKDTFDYRMLKPVVGEGLLTSDGPLWLHQRRLMQPAFHRRRIAAFADLMTARTAAMLERWDALARRGTVVDVSTEMARLTLDIATRTLFGVELHDEAAAVGTAFTVLNTQVTEAFYSLLAMIPGVRAVAGRRARAAKRTLDAVVMGIIGRRRRQGDQGDLLSLLLAARDEDTGEGLSDQQLHDEVLTLLLAGHETTANLLSWTWYLLSTHPLAAARLRAELARVLSGRLPLMGDLPRLAYTRMVLDEALRLYPPAWIVSRAPIADDVIDGYAIPAGAVVTLSPYATHRHPEFWDNPEGFDPERFTPERVAARPRFAYFPFGGGPRQCIGNGFALQEAALVLATVAQRYRLDLVPGHAVVAQPLITLRPRGGLPMTVHAV